MSFDLAMPRSPDEAIGLLDPADLSIRAVAGGTALMLMIKFGFYRLSRLVSLARLGGEWRQIRITAEGGLRVGAMVRLRDLERSPAESRRLLHDPGAWHRLAGVASPHAPADRA